MPKGYVIGRANVTNPTAWAEYAAKASEAIKKYGGNPIVRGGKMETVEGQGVPRNVVIEFASFEAARTYAILAGIRGRQEAAAGRRHHRLRDRRRSSLASTRSRRALERARRPGGQRC